MEEGIEEPRSGGDRVREEMQMVLDSTVDIVQENMEDKARGELQRPTQRRTFKEILAKLRDKKKRPWKWECYFCEGEHWSSECPQRLILRARIQKWENEEEWDDSDSDLDSDSDSEEEEEEEEEEEIGPTHVSTEDRGSEPHLDITERKEDGSTTEGVVPKETEVEGGPVTEEFFPNDIKLILMEDQDSLYNELPPKEVEPKMELSSGVEALNRKPYRMAPLELAELREKMKDSCWRMSSNTQSVGCEKNNHSKQENFKKTSIQKSESKKEREKTLLQLRNFHEEKT